MMKCVWDTRVSPSSSVAKWKGSRLLIGLCGGSIPPAGANALKAHKVEHLSRKQGVPVRFRMGAPQYVDTGRVQVW